MSFRVKVALRVRPPTPSKQQQQKHDDENDNVIPTCVRTNSNEISVISPNQSKPDRKFAFDTVFDSKTPQETVYKTIGRDLVNHALEGYNSCLFAYGQTGSGKTFSVVGTPTDPGLVYRVCKDIFNLKTENNMNTACTVRLSMLEVYKERIRDLFQLSAIRKLRGVGDKCYVEDLAEITVNSVEQVEQLILKGAKSRATAATDANDQSSRSHAVITLKITQQRPQQDDPFKTEEVVSSIRLVDLAGSERAGANSNTERAQEGSSINKSLVSLGRVIHTIAQLSENPQANLLVPYRDSVLTRLLQSNLAGNSRTTMLACVSGSIENYDQTVSTLRYADQAKKLKTSAVQNKEMLTEADQSARLAKLQSELLALRQQLDQERSSSQLQAVLKFYEDQAAREQVQIAVLEAQKQTAENQHVQLGNFLREHLSTTSTTTASNLKTDLANLETEYLNLKSLSSETQQNVHNKFLKWRGVL